MMIRRTVCQLGALVLPAVLLLGPVPALAQESPARIAVVDVQKVVAGSIAGQEMQAMLSTFRSGVERELKAATQAVRDLQTSAALAGSPAEAAELQKELENKTIALNRLQDDMQREGQEKQTAALRSIEAQLEPIFRQIRDEHDYDLILARSPGLTLMISPRIDITQEVIDRFNASSQ